MGQRSKVSMLPPEILAWVEKTIVARNFSQYRELTEEINRRLAEAGEELRVSKTGLHEHGQALEEKLAAIKDSTMAAAAIHAAAPDDEDARSAASLSLIQTEFFSTLLALKEAEREEDPERRLKVLSRAGVAFDRVTRASIAHKKYAREVRERALAAAAAAERVAKKGGLSAEAVNEIRASILGIAA